MERAGSGFSRRVGRLQAGVGARRPGAPMRDSSQTCAPPQASGVRLWAIPC